MVEHRAASARSVSGLASSYSAMIGTAQLSQMAWMSWRVPVVKDPTATNTPDGGVGESTKAFFEKL